MRLFSSAFLSEGYFPTYALENPLPSTRYNSSHSQEIVKLTSIPFIRGPCEDISRYERDIAAEGGPVAALELGES
jgi:hypothetical protein